MYLWLERWVLGGVCVGVFVSVVLVNNLKLDLIQRITLFVAVASFSLFVGRTIENGRRQQPSPSTNPPTTSNPKTPADDTTKPEAPPQPHTTAHLKPRPSHPQTRSLPPLTSLSDGQRFLLGQKLSPYAGNSVSLIQVGNDPQATIVFGQLIDAFKNAEWKIQTTQIGMVSVVGVNFPNNSYLTSEDIGNPVVKHIYSAFEAIGIDLPLTPDAYMGPRSGAMASDAVIVIR